MEESFDYRANADNPDQDYDKVLRPKTLEDFAGQPSVVENLSVFVKAAKLRKEPLDHVLLHGPPGLGKTTLANIIANEMGVGFKVTSGPVLDKPGDLAGLLTNLSEGDVLFIDEIHPLVGAGAAEGAIDAASILRTCWLTHPFSTNPQLKADLVMMRTLSLMLPHQAGSICAAKESASLTMT